MVLLLVPVVDDTPDVPPVVAVPVTFFFEVEGEVPKDDIDLCVVPVEVLPVTVILVLPLNMPLPLLVVWIKAVAAEAALLIEVVFAFEVVVVAVGLEAMPAVLLGPKKCRRRCPICASCDCKLQNLASPVRELSVDTLTVGDVVDDVVGVFLVAAVASAIVVVVAGIVVVVGGDCGVLAAAAAAASAGESEILLEVVAVTFWSAGRVESSRVMVTSLATVFLAALLVLSFSIAISPERFTGAS